MIEQYVSAWNGNNFEAYKREFAKCRAADAVYIDPYSEIKGLDELAGFAQKSLEIMRSLKILFQIT
ncbi:MAG: nuclear transport factor 2 family protein [Flavobacterium sp.]